MWAMGAVAAGVWRLASGPAIWQWRVTAAARSSADAASAFASLGVNRRLPVLREKDMNTVSASLAGMSRPIMSSTPISAK